MLSNVTQLFRIFLLLPESQLNLDDKATVRTGYSEELGGTTASLDTAGTGKT